jgi:hypothetical protein
MKSVKAKITIVDIKCSVQNMLFVFLLKIKLNGKLRLTTSKKTFYVFAGKTFSAEKGNVKM